MVEKEKVSSRVKLSTADIPPGHWGAAAAAAVVDTSVVVTASRATAAANKLANGIIINRQPKDWGRVVWLRRTFKRTLVQGPSFLKGNVCMCVYVCVYSHVDHNPLLAGTVGGGLVLQYQSIKTKRAAPRLLE